MSGTEHGALGTTGTTKYCAGCEKWLVIPDWKRYHASHGELETDTYHLTEHGTKWPNCVSCKSENTTVVPKTGEWTCQDCGRQWHSDETPVDDGDAPEIGGEIEKLLHALADESPRAVDRLARERGVHPEGGSR